MTEGEFFCFDIKLQLWFGPFLFLLDFSHMILPSCVIGQGSLAADLPVSQSMVTALPL